MTTSKSTLMKVRRSAKKRKPNFVVKESHFLAKIEKRWRLPRGLHSAARQRYAGRPAQPHPGYGSPREVRGLDRSGLRPQIVHNEKELNVLDPLVCGAVVASTVGAKKRVSLLKLAQQKKITVLSTKNVATTVAEMTQAFALRQKERASRRQTKNKKEEAKRKRSEEKEKQKKEETQSKTAENIPTADAVAPDGEKEEVNERIAEKTITKRQ